MAFELTNRPIRQDHIRKEAFSWRPGLKEVNIGEGLEEIWEGNLCNCKCLEVERSDQVWEKGHKHVLEIANAADGIAASEVGDDCETINTTKMTVARMSRS